MSVRSVGWAKAAPAFRFAFGVHSAVPTADRANWWARRSRYRDQPRRPVAAFAHPTEPVGWARSPAGAQEVPRRSRAILPTRSDARADSVGIACIAPPPYPPPHAGEGREGE